MTSTSPLKAAYLYHSRPQKRSPEMDTKAIVHSVLADGTEHVVSYAGTGQYSIDGMAASACGLAVLNFAMSPSPSNKAVCKTQLFCRPYQLASAPRCEHRKIPYPSTALFPQETTAICASWSGNLHLDVEDICRVPLFDKTLKLKTATYGQLGVSEFKTLLT